MTPSANTPGIKPASLNVKKRKQDSRPADASSTRAGLRERLAEAEETLRAIRNGEVDAVVVAGALGDQVFTLDGAGHAYRVLIESMSEGALTLTTGATILYANHCFAAMIGRPLEQVIGSSFHQYLTPEDRERLDLLVRQSDQSGAKLQVTLATLPGPRLVVQLSLRPLPRDGVSAATIGMVVTDLTEAHRIAAQKETERLYALALEHAAGLERRVAERTDDLLHANQELEAFEASVSHDLRGPLRSVMGYSEIVLGDFAAEVPAEALVYLRKIRDSAGRMQRLIESLLELSRASKQSLSRESVDLSAMFQDVLEELAPGQAGDVTIAPFLPCQGDPILLRQVVVNLLGNALKFARQGEATRIDVSAVVPSDGTATRYSIRDNGIGFDMEHAGKLFAAFERLPNAGAFEGTGIGLATVQRIIFRHGGRIWAESMPGEGATFFFTLGPTAAAAG